MTASIRALRPWLVENGIPLTIAFVYALLTLTLFEPAFRFHGDHERDLRYATLLVQHGIWPDSSPAIAPTPFELGPTLYLLLAPIVAISPDPVHVRVGFVGLTSLAFLVLYRVLRRHVSPLSAGVAVFGLAISEFVYEASAQLWHSSLLALPIALFWSKLDRLVTQPSRTPDAVIAAILAGLMLQLHLTTLAYPGVLLVALFLARKSLGARGFMLSSGAFLLALTPFWVTLAQSLSRGALDHAGGSAHGWSPAPFWDVLGFIFENLHPVWGDDLGPSLVWPWLVLIGAGSLAATQTPFGRLLLINVVIGLLVEYLLLGNQRAHRYLHANLWALFLLVGLGAEALFTRLSAAWRPRVMALCGVLALTVTAEAVVSEVPRSDQRGWLNAVEQRAVAETIATHFPMSEAAMEDHVHGIYFGEPMGMRHWHLLFAPVQLDASPAQHVSVIPSDLPVTPFGAGFGRRYVVRGNGRDVAIQAFLPFFQSLTIQSPDAEALTHRWRRPRSAHSAPARHILGVTVDRAGAFTLALADGRGGERCAVTATMANRPLAVAPLDAPDYSWIRFVTVPVLSAGAVEIVLGPCRAPSFVDIF